MKALQVDATQEEYRHMHTQEVAKHVFAGLSIRNSFNENMSKMQTSPSRVSNELERRKGSRTHFDMIWKSWSENE